MYGDFGTIIEVGKELFNAILPFLITFYVLIVLDILICLYTFRKAKVSSIWALVSPVNIFVVWYIALGKKGKYFGAVHALVTIVLALLMEYGIFNSLWYILLILEILMTMCIRYKYALSFSCSKFFSFLSILFFEFIMIIHIIRGKAKHIGNNTVSA